MMHTRPNEVQEAPEGALFLSERQLLADALDGLSTLTLSCMARYQEIMNDSPTSITGDTYVSAELADIRTTITRGVWGFSVPRMFDGVEHDPTPETSLVNRLVTLRTDETLIDLNGEKYGRVEIPQGNGSKRVRFVRYANNGIRVFGSTLGVPPRARWGVREADADDCCRLVENIRAVLLNPIS